MPKPQLLDLMRMACEPQLVHDYNQFLSKGAEEAFWKDVLWWLEICVLEDKMHRLLELSGDDAANPEKLVQVFASQGQGGWTAHGGSYRDVHQVGPMRNVSDSVASQGLWHSTASLYSFVCPQERL